MATGILNHMVTAGQALKGMAASPMGGSTNGTSGTTGASGTDNSDDTSNSSATISANDFLTLLVTEMQNQDPTADTDPNQYINQLVQVNSLEQLIDINQTLSGALGSTSSGSGTGTSGQSAGTSTAVTGTSAPSTTAAAHVPAAAPAAASAVPAATAPTTAARRTAGNVGVPGANPAAQRVGHALSGRTLSRPAKGSAIPLQ
ncbi:MAG: flagellar hook capping FlgD N-terminal domain-containing protein [Terracidiphilus sp.]|jgi:flagellar basal-body rod modification protein FlgD